MRAVAPIECWQVAELIGATNDTIARASAWLVRKADTVDERWPWCTITPSTPVAYYTCLCGGGGGGGGGGGDSHTEERQR